jgi:hypothetical protein
MSSDVARGRDELFARARKIADAVLYEGYVLYPYRASARKNQVRWQFGVLAPRDWSHAGGCEEWWAQTECLFEAESGCRLIGKTRFLQIQTRTIEALDEASGRFRFVPSLETDERLWTSWEEGVEREVDFEVTLRELRHEEIVQRLSFPRSIRREEIKTQSGKVVGRVVREQLAITGDLRLALERLDLPSPLYKLRVRVENVTQPATAVSMTREQALPSFFVGVHTLLAVRAGIFLSLADPPDWAAGATARCLNQRAWPVLIGEGGQRDVVLSSPIILDDYPQVAPESPGELCDATEIDEILTLRTMTLTDQEKREARATDARAAAIIDRADSMPPEMLERLHGTIRSLRDVAPEQDGGSAQVPWWDPAADSSVDPETDSVEIRGAKIAKGSRVRLCPGSRGADAQDMFLVGRMAVVEGVFLDVEDRHYLAVTLEDDPAADLHQWHGRYFYFAPDEVEPIEERDEP